MVAGPRRTSSAALAQVTPLACFGTLVAPRPSSSMAEQLTLNQLVQGSSPWGATTAGGRAPRPRQGRGAQTYSLRPSPTPATRTAPGGWLCLHRVKNAVDSSRQCNAGPDDWHALEPQGTSAVMRSVVSDCERRWKAISWHGSAAHVGEGSHRSHERRRKDCQLTPQASNDGSSPSLFRQWRQRRRRQGRHTVQHDAGASVARMDR